MNNWLVYSIGFIAQILFSLRLIIQWLKSEKEKRVVAPTLFWTLSLLTSFLLFVYGYLRQDFSIMLGQLLTYYIYIRNLQLQNQWQKLSKLTQHTLFFLPVLLTSLYYVNNQIDMRFLFKNETIPFWLHILGITSQMVFTFRFVYQWLSAERKKESILPKGFWYISLIGAFLILTYAILRKDPVLFIGHLFGIVIYIRNLGFNLR